MTLGRRDKCQRCKGRLPHPGPPWSCQRCIDHIVELTRQRHAGRAAAGVCIYHPDRTPFTKTLCRECWQKKQDYYLRRKQLSAVQCVRGNHPNDQPERSLFCRACTDDVVAFRRTPRGKRYMQRYHKRRRLARLRARRKAK